MKRTLTRVSILFVLTLMVVGGLYAQGGMQQIQLYAKTVDRNGDVSLEWKSMNNASYVKYVIMRGYASISALRAIDSTRDQYYTDHTAADAVHERDPFLYQVYGVSATGAITPSNVVMVQVPIAPAFSSFDLDAHVEQGTVNLAWHKVEPRDTTIKVLGYEVYRVTLALTAGSYVSQADTVKVATTTETSAADVPEVAVGTTKYFAYVVRCLLNVDKLVLSNAAYVKITGVVPVDRVTFISTPVKEGTVSVQYAYTAQASSSDPAAVITYTLFEAPRGMQIDAVTGAVTFTPLVKGYYHVEILATSSKGGRAYQDYTLQVSGGNATIAGRVVDSLGTPIGGVLIEALGRKALVVNSVMPTYSSGRAVTDSLGYYQIKKLDPGTYLVHAMPMKAAYYEQWFNGKTSALTADSVILDKIDAVAPRVDFTLRARVTPTSLKVTVSGTVKDTNGLALSVKARVYFVRTDFALNTTADVRNAFDLKHEGSHQLDGSSKYVMTAVVDSTGAYTVKLAAGTYIAYAVADGYLKEFYNEQSSILQATQIVVAATAITDINFTLIPAPPIVTGSIAGRVLDTVNNTGVMARIIAFLAKPAAIDPALAAQYKFVKSYTVDTDSLGQYELGQLLPGKYIVLAIPMGSYAPAFYGTGTQTFHRKDATPVAIDGNNVGGIDIYVKALPDSAKGYTGVAGYVLSRGAVLPGVLVFAMNSAGNAITYGITDAAGKYTLAGMAPGAYLLTTEAYGYTSTGNVAVLPRYDASSQPVVIAQNLVMTSDEAVTVVESPATEQPAAYALEQNYPNPFNPSTTINYSLAAAGHVTLKVYNILGQAVATLVNGQQNAGAHTIVFNAARMTSGVYFYRLEAGAKSFTRKMILMK